MTQATSTPRIDIIIVNWNAGDHLRKCLASIPAATRKDLFNLSVIVVDNGSTDNSLEGLSELAIPLRVIRNTVNRGFAAACNQGAAGSRADYLLFLNPDTILYPDSLLTPVRFMERPDSARIGIIGIQLVDENGTVSRTCSRFPTTGMFVAKTFGLDRLLPGLFPTHGLLDWDHLSSREVDQIMGAFFLVRSRLFTSLGGFDERFFVYFEEVDFSLRALSTGWKSYYLADAQAYHHGCGTTEQVRAMRLFYSLRSRILYGFKHFGVLSAACLLFATLVLEPLARLALLLAKCSLSGISELCTGYLKVWKELPMLLKQVCREKS